MGPLTAVNHLANLLAPALLLALALPALGRLLLGARASRLSYGRQVLVQAIAAVGITLLGLWLGGADGRMLTYVALTLAGGTLQWCLQSGWRRA